MDLDDILEEEKYDMQTLLSIYEQRELDQEQPLISIKNTKNVFSVEREYVNSKEYHDKFENLQISKTLQESLYKQTGRLLEFVDSLPEEQMGQERLVAVNFRTGDFIVDNFDRDGEINKTSFNDREMDLIEKCKDSIVLIHNHSKSDKPSGQDLLSYLRNEKVKLSLIACHNGDLYAIYGVKPIFEIRYNELLEIEKIKTTEINIAKRRATTQAYIINDNLSERHQYFNVVKL